MAKETTTPRFNPPRGRKPELVWLDPAEILVDAGYQRSIEGETARKLIREIAADWDWDLCQPIAVSRREDGTLWVIDGQHRHAAAKLRGDISLLPAQVLRFSGPAEEAEAFVRLNQQRRRLSGTELFRAAVAAGDPEKTSILAAIEGAGLTIAPHQNYQFWKPGMIFHLAGIEKAWREHGEEACSTALVLLRQAWPGSVLRYGATLFPGIAAVAGDEFAERGRFEEARFEAFLGMLAKRSQYGWVEEMGLDRQANPGLSRRFAMLLVMRRAWAVKQGKVIAAPAARPVPPRPVTIPAGRQPEPATGYPIPANDPRFANEGRGWCDQCDRLVTREAAVGCRSAFCSFWKDGRR
jgi:hypothetical protein